MGNELINLLQDGPTPRPPISDAAKPPIAIVGIGCRLPGGANEPTAVDVYSNTGAALSLAANRISYHFNWKGRSAVVDTACSSVGASGLPESLGRRDMNH
jgi:acyl transferase domain-containing protein